MACRSVSDGFFKILNLSFLLSPLFFPQLEGLQGIWGGNRDKGVSVVVASPEDVDAANKERSNYFDVKKAL
jgi:hypothetical protein